MTQDLATVRFELGGGPVVAERGLPFPVVVLAVVSEEEGFRVVVVAAPPEDMWLAQQRDREPGAFIGAFELDPGADPDEGRREFLEEWWHEPQELREPPMPTVAAESSSGVGYKPTWAGLGYSGDLVEVTVHFEPALPPDATDVMLLIGIESPGGHNGDES